MVKDPRIITLRIPRTKLDEAGARGPGAMIELGIIPARAVVTAQWEDAETGDFCIDYIPIEATTTALPPEEAIPTPAAAPPVILRAADRVVPLERIAMVAHEMIRCYHIATTGNPPAGWDELEQRDKLAEMGRCSLMRDENLTVSSLFANSNRIPGEHERAVDRVENTLRACVVRAFNLTT